MINQTNTFKSDFIINKLERRKIITDGKTLIIKSYKTLNIYLPHSNLRL
jgi:hypothetical protein